MPLDWLREGARWPNRGLSRFVTTRGVRWHIQRGGAGPGVLLIHGAGASTHSWAGLISLLADRFEILAMDLPGQGFSTGAAPRFTLPWMARDIGALLAAEGFAPRLIVGHSAGAAIALRMVLDGAAAPEAVIALNGALTPFRGMAGVLFPPLAKMLALNPFSGSLFARTAATPGAVRGLIEGTGSRIGAEDLARYERLIRTPSHVSATLAMMARWDLVPLMAELPRVAVPVVLAAGLKDRAVPPETAQEVARHLRRAEVRAFPGLGHLMHEEDPAAVAALVAEVAGAVEAAETGPG
jgi:magnesium chelatase accessory protein